MSGFDLADPDSGVFATAHSGRAAIVFERDQVLAAGPAAEALGGRPGESTSLALDGTSLAIELAPLHDPVRLDGSLVGSAEVTVCRAVGALQRNSDATPIDCLAVTTQAAGAELEGTELRRSVAVAFADGGLLALLAARPQGARGHGEEEVVARLTDREGEVAISEALLSTEYDEDGRHRRANIELWREAELPMRAAGTIVCGATVDVGDLRVETAFFRWSLDGRPGLGRYEVIRRA